MTALHPALKPCFPVRPPQLPHRGNRTQSGITLALFLDSPVATEKMEKKTGEEVGHHGKGFCVSLLVNVPGLPDKLCSRCSAREMSWESSETF